MKLAGWTPKSLVALRDYNRKKFAADLSAGVTVGLVALPLSIAFAIASGTPPEAGLYTAVGSGRTLLLCGAREQPARLMGQASFAQHVGQENICAHVTAALVRAQAIHDQATSGVLAT
jgi:MFS superfamily sulfate permease-like transporter